MPSLAELQRDLARGLTARGVAPASEAIDRARRALVDKRSRAAGRLLPFARTALGAGWTQRFAAHAAVYVPCGLLYHVDDAWAFALALAADGDAAVRRAAHDDVVSLRVRWTRSPRASALRIAERRSMVVAITSSRGLWLVVRMPGVEGRVWRVPVRRDVG